MRDKEPITERYSVSAGQKYHCQPVTACEIEKKKKSEPSDKLFFSNILKCAGADRCSPVCQVQHCSICEHADQLPFASVFQCRHTSGKQELYQKTLSVLQRPGEPIQTQVRKTGRGLRISKQTPLTLPSPALFTHPGMHLLQLSNYFPEWDKYWINENLLIHLAFWSSNVCFHGRVADCRVLKVSPSRTSLPVHSKH